MRNELFGIQNADVAFQNFLILNHFTLHIYQGYNMGIICDNITERNLLIEFFRGNCAVSGNIKFSQQKITKMNRALFTSYFFVINNQINLIPSLSISENICLFSSHSSVVHTHENIRRTKKYLEHFQLSIDINQKINELSTEEAIIVELLKAYAEERKIIVLANLTEILSPHACHIIEWLVRQMSSEGITFLLIDSLDSSFFDLCEKITIVKNRTSIACFDAKICKTPEFYKYLYSNEKNHMTNYIFHENDEDLSPQVEFLHVSTNSLTDMSFSLCRGELIKIFCMDACSIQAFKDMVYGTSHILSGKIMLNNQSVSSLKNLRSATKKGIYWCPETPYSKLLFRNSTIRENLLLVLSRKIPAIWAHKKYIDSIDLYIKDHIGNEYINKKVYELDPNTLQLVAYTKILLSAPKVVFLEKPFYNIDPHIKETTLQMITKLQERGICVIILTNSISDLYLKDGDILYLNDGKTVSADEIYGKY